MFVNRARLSPSGKRNTVRGGGLNPERGNTHEANGGNKKGVWRDFNPGEAGEFPTQRLNTPLDRGGDNNEWGHQPQQRAEGEQ